MRLEQYIEDKKEMMIEKFEDEYGFDVACVLQNLLDELSEYDLDKTYKLYELFDMFASSTNASEETTDEWFANDICDGRLEMFADYMEDAMDNRGFNGVVDLFESTRAEIRYQALFDHDASIVDYMNAIFLMDLGYADIDEDFFKEMCEYALDRLVESERINIKDIFINTLGESGWNKSNCGSTED